MTNATQLFALAQLAEASYADLIGTENTSDLLKTRLIARNGDKRGSAVRKSMGQTPLISF